MLVYVSLRVLDDHLHPLSACTLFDRAVFPAGKRRRRAKHQTSYANSAVLYARVQGRFAKTVNLASWNEVVLAFWISPLLVTFRICRSPDRAKESPTLLI